MPSPIPYLSGQYAQYTASQLKMWQRAYRRSSLEAMALIANQLDDQDVAAVAAYYQQLRGSPEASGQPKK